MRVYYGYPPRPVSTEVKFLYQFNTGVEMNVKYYQYTMHEIGENGLWGQMKEQARKVWMEAEEHGTGKTVRGAGMTKKGNLSRSQATVKKRGCNRQTTVQCTIHCPSAWIHLEKYETPGSPSSCQTGSTFASRFKLVCDCVTAKYC